MAPTDGEGMTMLSADHTKMPDDGFGLKRLIMKHGVRDTLDLRCPRTNQEYGLH